MTESEVFVLRKLSLEVATDHLQTLLDFNEIDYDDEEGVVEQFGEKEVDVAASLRSGHKKLLKAIKSGRLVINEGDDGRVTCTQHLKLKYEMVDGPLHWGVLNGAAGRLAAKAGIKVDDYDGQLKCLAAAMTKRDLSHMVALEGPDFTLMKALAMLFFVA